MRLTPSNPDGFEAEVHGPLYRLSDARRAFDHVDDLGVNPGLYLAWSERGHTVEFSVLTFATSGAFGEPDEDEVFCACMMYGDGTPFDRDMRHSNWGESGYLHCLGAAELIAIGKALGRWFR